VEFCGDSITNNVTEACDSGGVQTAGCEADCTAPLCGDGTLNGLAGEACDDGNTTPGDGCNAVCVAEFCGDGIVNNSIEVCDDGFNTGLPGSCAIDCSAAIP
jgi:cysteine-rich repeat protein